MVHYTASAQDSRDLYFQPAYATGAPASKIFEEINYIPLQTTKKSIFGRIRQLLVSDEYFIIWDADTNFIYFFDKKGKFVKKYRPPNCTVKTIQLDKGRNALFISGSNKNFSFSPAEVEKMMEDPTNRSFARFTWSAWYDLSDIHKEKIQRLKDFSLALVSPTIFNNWWAYSYVFANRKFNDNTGYELKVYDGEKNIREDFSYNKRSEAFYYKPEQVSFFPTSDKERLLFTRPYNYSIYQLTKDSVSLLYTLILPLENSLPKAFFTHPFRSKNDLDLYRTQNGSFVWKLDYVYRMQHYLFFSLDYNKSPRERNFMFDEATRRFYNTGKINTDSANAYLPLLQAGIQYADDSYLYSSASSSSMFQSNENNKPRDPQYTPVIKQYFEKGTRTDNPVIIQLKLKNKIG
ncbi:hypothetical protein GCM10027516_30880 [Niabella aquatica]